MNDATREQDEWPSGGHDEPKVKPGRWVVRLVLALVLVVAAILLWQLVESAAPRWWSHRIGDRADGELLRGLGLGLGIGFVFSFAPLLLLFQVRRRFLSWAARGVLVVIALALALPNWLTLWVAFGTSKSTHAAERTFDVDAPWFQGGSVIGAVVGGALAFLLSGTAMWMSHRKKQVRSLKAERDDYKRREQEREAQAQHRSE